MPDRHCDRCFFKPNHGFMSGMVDLYTFRRLDFPIPSYHRFVMNVECINKEVLEMIAATESSIYTFNIGSRGFEYEIEPTGVWSPDSETLEFGIYLMYDKKTGDAIYELLNTFTLADLPEDAKWADLLAIRRL